MRKQRIQAGFTLVEALLIILILVIIGFAGYYVWDRQSSKDDDVKKSANTTSKSDSNTKKSADETADWLIYEPDDKSYKIKLPDGWKFDYNSSEKLLYASTVDMKDALGIEAVVNTTTGGYGMGTGFALSIQEVQEGTDYSLGEKHIASFKTGDGAQIEGFMYENSEEGNMSYEVGAKIYTYYLSTDGKTYKIANYTFNPSAKDQRSTVEKSIKTIVLP